MKSFPFILSLALAASAYSQQKPCEAPEASQFDFWLGEWTLSWPAEQMGGTAGELGKGTNKITKILGDCIVKEEFSFPAGNFYGNSVSVYSPAKGLWQQTWVDNQGGYLVFTGEFKDGKMFLKMAPFQRAGQTVVNRMVFRNITADSLDWDWQTSEDGGENWKDLWNIHYQKKQMSQSN
jgi:hypothetical protein